MRITTTSRTMVTGLVLAAGGAAWAGGGRATIEETARFIAARGRAGQELRAAGAQTTFTELGITNAGGQVVVAAAPDQVGDGAIVWSSAAGVPRGVLLVSEQNAGQVAVFNTAGNPRFILDGNAGLLSAPGDVAERFPASIALEPGSVVAIDPAAAGAVIAASRPYDRRVAGVVSGANNYRPGITLRADDSVKQAVPVTLTGTVYCLASSVNGPVRAGDLLTTSAVSGYAMRATDLGAAHGAIVGKALEDLQGERGLVMILASLQ
jgi:hypothetical protein